VGAIVRYLIMLSIDKIVCFGDGRINWYVALAKLY
jgi:hypothetical protein